MSKFFVVVGAMDGIRHSNFGQRVLDNPDWSGLMIEPVKYYYDKLRTKFDRDNIILENIAIDSRSGIKDIYTIDPRLVEQGLVPEWADGISTFNPDQTAMKSLRDYSYQEKVTCSTMEDVVTKHNIKNIDILHIDTEGHDYIVFEQIWQLGFRPKEIVIEVVSLKLEPYMILLMCLVNTGYEIKRIGDDIRAFHD